VNLAGHPFEAFGGHTRNDAAGRGFAQITSYRVDGRFACIIAATGFCSFQETEFYTGVLRRPVYVQRTRRGPFMASESPAGRWMLPGAFSFGMASIGYVKNFQLDEMPAKRRRQRSGSSGSGRR
jgi:hypothetical protein